MMNILGALLPNLFKIGDKLIEDKDKKMEYAFKLQEMAQTMGMKLLDTKTYPWIDGLVKLAYSSEALIKGLFRPIAAAAAMVFAAYCEYNGIELSQTLEAVLVSLLPGWMYSRHQSKKDEKLGPP